ncbi:hypothetical protein, unlikely [Trypanosoma brucei gambiense DAL972]|uniref:Uncharacterized protein n=1 Tax=Trypanosoma brucei gambiense (strain MHOM/CI/86/DAL972) TaxID=679716 RepID=D0A7V7_TRYB9|nr:hypothetical protein, unlikely [Trypanosoma brucei gambiense DAL972]CBH17758.1 hypothetical protein, unlikely [Trypanosoma brucei gambiense DAL972]|eukprot:XP_011780022.1 hypothetical protein, unlikely [Trypanosoma brucei gambiense DAL972]
MQRTAPSSPLVTTHSNDRPAVGTVNSKKKRSCLNHSDPITFFNILLLLLSFPLFLCFFFDSMRKKKESEENRHDNDERKHENKRVDETKKFVTFFPFVERSGC